MKKVLIIEDEITSAKRMERMLADINDTWLVDGPLQTVEDVADTLRQHNDYDLIFSDIRLRDGEVFDAFDVVMPNSFVIFTTAYDTYAMQAIKNHGLDYLLKPFSTDELREAIAKTQLGKADVSAHQQRLRALKDSEIHYRERFLLGKQDEMVPVATDNILYFYKNERCINAVTADGEVYTLYMQLKELEEQLDPTKFFRLNRQYIANINAIKRIGQFFSSKLVVRLYCCDDKNIVVSKERAIQLKEWLSR